MSQHDTNEQQRIETREHLTLGGTTRTVDHRVTGDTPAHGKHLLWDSHNNTVTECNGGMAFAIGVATMESELTRDPYRFIQVQHPNGVAIYHVAYMPSGQVITTKVST